MKRPEAVYAAIGILSLAAAVLWFWLVTAELGIYPSVTFKRLDQMYLSILPVKAALWAFALALVAVIYGFFQCRVWARKIAFLLIVLVLLVFGGDLINVFTITHRPLLSGSFLNVVLFKLGIFLGAASTMLLMLRPEVGRFFKGYPPEAGGFRKSSSPD